MLTSPSARNHVCRQCLITVRINKVRREHGVSILFRCLCLANMDPATGACSFTYMIRKLARAAISM